MRKNKLYVAMAVVMAVALLLAGFSSLTKIASATPVAEAEYTQAPVAAVLYTGTFLTSAVQYGSPVNVINFDATEMQYVIDQTAVVSPTQPNTLTLTLQYSNDQVNWTDQALVSNNIADASGWLTPTVTGRFWRVKLTPTNDLTTTVSVITVLK
jgi:hypothetical protein